MHKIHISELFNLPGRVIESGHYVDDAVLFQRCILLRNIHLVQFSPKHTIYF